MNLVFYKPEKHQELLQSWLSEHGIPTGAVNLLSDTGLICPDVEDAAPAAMAFLYTTNSPEALIDRVVTRPGLSRTRRVAALSRLFKGLSDLARNRGYSLVSTLGRTAGVHECLTEAGFIPMPKPYNLYHKDVR